MTLEQILDQFEHDPQLARRLTRWQHLPPRPSRYAAYPAGIDPRLVEALRQRGIEQLYTHQAQAVDAALRGENVVVVTPTASGKTLCYNLPVLNHAAGRPGGAGALPVPHQGPGPGPAGRAGGHARTALGEKLEAYTYDGDTPTSARPRIRKTARIVITNPDMLHAGILPHHTRWAQFFQGCATSSWTRSTPTAASLAATWPTCCAG